MKLKKCLKIILTFILFISSIIVFNGAINSFASEATTEPYIFLTKWGSKGFGDGQFDFPSGIAVDKDNYIYVADTNNHRIQKFDCDGNFLTKWGVQGYGDGQFVGPAEVSIGPDNYIYVVNCENNRIQKFTLL